MCLFIDRTSHVLNYVTLAKLAKLIATSKDGNHVLKLSKQGTFIKCFVGIYFTEMNGYRTVHQKCYKSLQIKRIGNMSSPLFNFVIFQFTVFANQFQNGAVARFLAVWHYFVRLSYRLLAMAKSCTRWSTICSIFSMAKLQSRDTNKTNTKAFQITNESSV